jgi:hypothetical protein
MSDATDINNNIDGLIYAVDSSKWNHLINTTISSNLNVIQTAIIEDGSLIKQNTTDANKYIYYDYVRFMTYHITGIFTGIIFDNEIELRNDVISLDEDFHTSIIDALHKPEAGAGVVGGKIGDLMTNGSPGDAEGKSYGSINTHVNNISKNIMLTLFNGTSSQQQRIHTVFENYNYSDASCGECCNDSNADLWQQIPLIFGDKITFTITISPKSTNPLGHNSIPNKTYTINLLLI